MKGMVNAMKTIKRVLSGVLAAAMLAASASFVSSAQVTFTDVDGHWAENYITYLVEKDVLNGYKQNDGTYMFKPEDTVTRAEFIKMLDETFGLVETANISGKYKDVEKDDWFYEYFAKAVAQGYIHNYGDNATPNGSLSREEATSLLVRYLDLPDDEKVSTTTFADYGKISSYYKQDVLKAAKASLINGYKEDDGTYTFRPQNTLTRAEALTILYRAAGVIFTEDRSSTDTAAFDNNAVIKKGGIVLTNQTLDGRVIISEGADSGTVFFKQSTINDTLYVRGGANITLESTKVKTLVVDSPDIVSITLQKNSAIETLIINERCTMMIGTGTVVHSLTSNEDAEYVAITGTGTIKKAVINSDGFTSTMVPHEFEIMEQCTATFASKKYQGSSDAQTAFLNTPFMTKENNVHTINVLPMASGTIRYYFTNAEYCPGISDFDSYYNSSAYKSSFDVRANTSESEHTYDTSYVGSFGYIVLQLESDGRYFPPVIIPNKDASGTGFATTPTLKDQSTVTYATSTTGTVYYMYTTVGVQMNTNDFLLAYNDQTKSLKGESSDRSGTVAINATYAAVNRYMIFMFKSSDGLYHTPVIVALGDDGFSKEPTVLTHGTIEYTPSVTGTLYYYYSNSADLPAPEKFNVEWRDAEYSGDESVTKGQSKRLTYKTSYAEKYSYLVLCIRTNASEYMLPVVVEIDYDPGYLSMPEVVDETTIRFKTSDSGKVKYYYSAQQIAPTAATFEKAYSNTSAQYKGEVSVAVGYFSEIKYDASIASRFNYMVIMLEDMFGNDYQPVVVSLLTVSTTGFTTSPYVYGDTIYFKADSNCEVWYFYARSNDSIAISEFYDMWRYARYGDSVTASRGSLQSIPLDTDLLENYPYIVFSTSPSIESDAFTYPVVLDASKGAATDNDTGIRITDITTKDVTLTSFTTGSLFYYETNSSATPSKDNFAREYMNVGTQYRGQLNVSDGTENIRVTVSGVYKYVVLQMESVDSNGNKVLYKAVVVNTAEAKLPDENDPSGSGNTAQGYGFTVKSLDPSARTVTLVPTFSGKIKLTLASEDHVLVLSEKEYAVVAGSEISIPYPQGSGSIGGLNLFLFLQLTAENGDIYERYGGIELIQ